jgi:hypothetical protein
MMELSRDTVEHVARLARLAMSDAEKLELIEHVAHSVRASKNGGAGELAPAQKQRLLESVHRISGLPMQGPGRFSGRDHDQVLYGPSTKPDPRV